MNHLLNLNLINSPLSQKRNNNKQKRPLKNQEAFYYIRKRLIMLRYLL